MNTWHKGRGGGHWPGGSTRAYRKARETSKAEHLANGGGCQLRISPRCTNTVDEWHHTRDRRIVGDDPQYMVWSCRPCNMKAGDPTKGDPAPDSGTRW